MSSATFVVVRSMVSKIVSRSEVGSIFSLISSLDSLIPIIIAPGLTELYKVTIDFFPGREINFIIYYRVTRQVVPKMLLISKSRLRFSIDSVYKTELLI